MIALALKNEGIEDCTPEKGVERLITLLASYRAVSPEFAANRRRQGMSRIRRFLSRLVHGAPRAADFYAQLALCDEISDQLGARVIAKVGAGSGTERDAPESIRRGSRPASADTFDLSSFRREIEGRLRRARERHRVAEGVGVSEEDEAFFGGAVEELEAVLALLPEKGER